MKHQHPAIDIVMEDPELLSEPTSVGGKLQQGQTTSLSLARALAVGCLSGLDPSLNAVNIWDPAAGSGFAGFILAHALESAGIKVCYRGQDVNQSAVAASRRRLASLADAEVTLADTLKTDDSVGFNADMVIVDAPWGMNWKNLAPVVQSRRTSGAFSFGIPQQSDSTWLFISLALEKLRVPADGGGRVAALVNPNALSAGGQSGAVRRNIVEAGLFESVTRLPEGLAPNTGIPLYLLTFTNKVSRSRQGKAQIADLQSQFTTEKRHRSMPVTAIRELESGLRTWNSGRRNRTVDIWQFTRRDAVLTRTTSEKHQLSWRLTTYNGTEIDDEFLEDRYGENSGVSVKNLPRDAIDLDPTNIFGDNSRELIKDIRAKGWPSLRLSSVLAREPEAIRSETATVPEADLYIPTTQAGKTSTGPLKIESRGRVLAIRLDNDLLQANFLSAWLNSEQGITSRRRAVEASSSGTFVNALRSDPSSLMRWADELIIPVPDSRAQLALVSADEQLRSFQAELDSLRASIWVDPEGAGDTVNGIARAFDDSLESWLEQLPFPIASALWTAQTSHTPSEQQRAYVHAWEAIVAFHATVLLSAIQSDPGSRNEVETAIRSTLREQRQTMERATFGAWMVIIEKTSKEFRRVLKEGNSDDVARVRRVFGGLPRTGIEHLISTDLVKKFRELNTKRNQWLGHSGYTSNEDFAIQVASLVSDLRDLRQLLGNVWAQLTLVRAGSAKKRRDEITQTAEIAVGTRVPFATKRFSVGEAMDNEDLYLVRDGSQSPLRLGKFVQLKQAPRSAQYTSYFYNRTEGSNVHMVSYQFGSDNERKEHMETFLDDFGGLLFGIDQ